jgi:hypothetical protein
MTFSTALDQATFRERATVLVNLKASMDIS